MSNHATSTELLQEIRQVMTQLKSYLLQSSELQAMLEPQHQYTQDKLGNSTQDDLGGKVGNCSIYKCIFFHLQLF